MEKYVGILFINKNQFQLLLVLNRVHDNSTTSVTSNNNNKDFFLKRKIT